VHTLSQEATELHETARAKIAHFINAKDPIEVVYTRGTTEAINLVAYAWGLQNLKQGDEVLVSLMEHHSNLVPWQIISKLTGFTLRYIQVNADGTLNYEDLDSKISNKTKLVSISHISNVSGTINDIKRVARLAHDYGALMLADGAQSVPHMPIDVQNLDVDFLCFSGHKMLGPTGIGALYGKRDVLEKMAPFQGGGEMIREVSYDKSKQQCEISYNDLPWKFEAGTPNVAGSVGLAAAIQYLEKLGMENVLRHEIELTRYALKRFGELKKVTVYGPANLDFKCGIIPFSITGLSSHDIALFCDNYGIMLRSGFHCAQPLHQIFKLQSSARASLYIYNTPQEVDRFIEVLKELEEF
jgi:cysteine desulfurase/selenocysteine lyase